MVLEEELGKVVRHVKRILASIDIEADEGIYNNYISSKAP